MNEVLTLIESYIGFNSFPYTFSSIPTGNEFIIATANNDIQKQHWIRAGYIQAVAIIDGLETTGRPEFVTFGRQKISLQIPSIPYQIRFKPSSYVENWSIDLYEIESNLNYSEIARSTGLSIELLKAQSITNLQLLLGINNMPSSDTRDLTIEVNSIKDGLTGLSTRVDGQESATLKFETIQINSADFLPIANGRYLCTKTLMQVKGGLGLQLTLQDRGGDYQGLAQLISGVAGVEQNVGVELSAQQFIDADYPLSLVCQGQKYIAPTLNPSIGVTAVSLNGGFTAKLEGNILAVFNPDSTLYTATDSDISAAYKAGIDKIYFTSIDNLYYSLQYMNVSAPAYAVISQAEYNLFSGG